LEKNRAGGAERQGKRGLDFRFDVAGLRFRHEFDRSRNAPGAGYIPRCTNFRQPAVRIALPAVNRSGVLRRSNRKGCDLRPLMDWRFHLPFGPEAFWVLLALSEETR